MQVTYIHTKPFLVPLHSFFLFLNPDSLSSVFLDHKHRSLSLLLQYEQKQKLLFLPLFIHILFYPTIYNNLTGAKDKLPQEAQDLIGKTIARKRMQDRYISQIFELYEDFHVILMPLLDNEVRGVASLESFSALLLNPEN